MDPSQMMNRSFGMWAPPHPPPAPAPAPPADEPALPPPPFLPVFSAGAATASAACGRTWKSKKPKPPPPTSGGAGGYKPPALGDLQIQNRAKARRWFKNPNTNKHRGGGGGGGGKFFPRSFAAPRNTTSYIIRAKRAGGIASLVSPCPVTPAVLPTPHLSPTREGLVDMAHAEWGVDGYGSMKGLIRLRRPVAAGADAAAADADDSDSDAASSESDVEEHVEVERRLDHDLSRFEMVYPGNLDDGPYLFDEEDDQDTHIARLEEENLTLKERLFLMEREMGDMRRRLQALEARIGAPGGENENAADEEGAAAIEEASENDGERADGDAVSERSVGDGEDSEREAPMQE